MRIRRLLPWTAVALLALVINASAAEFSGRCVGVSDGDTLSVLHDGVAEKVRLHGIDTPESGQAYGSRAKQFTSAAAFDKVVAVTVLDRDRYGRTVGVVKLPDGKILNEELLRAGLAWWYRQYAPNDTTFRDLEAAAKAAKVGLWSDQNPVAPWQFRRGGSVTPSPADAKSIQPVPDASSAGVVYVTQTGTRYHADGCRYLAKSKIPMALAEASARYGPCSVCSPPMPSANSSTGSESDTAVIAPRGPPTENAGAADEPTVYGTRTGAKYHSLGCQYLSKSQIPMTLGQARSSGLTPCSRCGPPR